MSKKFIIGVSVVILVVLAVASWLLQDVGYSTKPPSERQLAKERAELAARSGETNLPPPAVLTPIDLSHPLRLAVGGLGQADEIENQKLGDLVTVQLTGAPGFELVERQSLSAILRELNLNWSGFVRAKDAVRAGKLLKADWFLLGTQAKIAGSNSIVARVVDARTGVMRDAGVFSAEKPVAQIAADLAAFLRESRQNAAHPQPRVFLAVGAFEDLSVNNRQADFPNQLRGYLTAAYRDSSVTLLEREYVETLLQEVHLDLAGLTEESWSNSPPLMQSAYWLVSGQYQSYETTNFQIELDLEVQRAFGKSFRHSLRALPGEQIGGQTKAAIDAAMAQNAGLVAPTRRTEARMQMEIGRDLSRLDKGFIPNDDSSLVWVNQTWDQDPEIEAKNRRRIQEAIRAFETVLLLEPTNREAKMHLAACLRNPVVRRSDEARTCYREIIDDPKPDKWTALAQQALGKSFLNFRLQDESPEETRRWYQSAAMQTTNPLAAAFYNQQAAATATEAILAISDSVPEKEKLAEQRLFAAIQSWKDNLNGKPGSYGGSFAMNDYAKALGLDDVTAAQKLAALLPKMEQQAPDMASYLLAAVLTHQVNAGTPLVGEFQRSLQDWSEHPEQILNPSQFWFEIRWSVYNWCAETTNYSLAAKLLETERRVAPKDIDFDDQEKMKLAYAYLAVQRWQDALAIFETFSNQTVRVENEGPWGKRATVVFPGKQADYCRQKLGVPVASSSIEFSMGEPLLCLCPSSIFTVNGVWATFTANDEGLWIGNGGRLLNLGFDLRTNLSINLPMNPDTPITALFLTSSNIWIATDGDGLIEFDKASRQCRQFTEKDGMLMNNVTSLHLVANTLWIGYGKHTANIYGGYQLRPGGLGNFDLKTCRFGSFTPPLTNQQSSSDEQPTRHSVTAITPGTTDEIWFLTDETPCPRLRRCQTSKQLWKAFQSSCTALDGNATQIVLAQLDSPLNIFTFDDGKWRSSSVASQLPSHLVSTITSDRDNVWVGGQGFIALIDPARNKVLRFALVKAQTVDRIQIAGGYVWAQFDWHLYRAPLSALQ